jgi:hypothetical protein
LIKGKVIGYSQSQVHFLSILAGWFKRENDRTIAYRILRKAEDLVNDKISIIDLHFLYNAEIEIYYRFRNIDSEMYNNAKQACRKQIAIASQVALFFRKDFNGTFFPGHRGFNQLTIIEEKEKNYKTVIELAKTAIEQGWLGDWEKKINRCNNKMNKNCT